jgi:D-alanyl-lipoteichoic acid acyltransferase DltB (MBOAT superfamily)
MLFNSFHFLFFFLFFWPIYLLLRGTPRKVFTLAASYYFYMCWSTKYIALIWGITIIDYIAGNMIARANTQRLKRFYLVVSLGSNLGILLVFKYFNFLSLSIHHALVPLGLHDPPLMLAVILPIGLSFHTFQAMSYTIDIYKGKAKAEKSLLNYALFVAFFPQMVAGPIERPNQLLPQFHGDPKFSWENVRVGGRLTLWGLFKKMVIADGLSGFVNLVYANPSRYTGAELLVATIFFSLQIYCDFSGYSDMAIGLARMMGFYLTINFRQPYLAKSIGEFWHRWHISLSTWFRDYVYIQLGGNRVSRARFYLNLMITFMLSGLWHGANWTFVIWGAFHGMCLVASHLTSRLRETVREALGLNRFPQLLGVLQNCFTLLLVGIGWVFFRAGTLRQAIYVLTHLLPLGGFDSLLLVKAGILRADLPFVVSFALIMFYVEWILAHPERRPALWSNTGFRFAMYYSCIFAIIFYGTFGHVDFIYFQF